MRKKMMKKGWMTLPALLLLAWVCIVSAEAKERYEEKFEKTENLARDGRVYVNNISGTIDVKTWDKEQVQINALKVSRASSLDRAGENAGLVTIEVTREGNLLRVETKYPRFPRRRGDDSLNVSIDYRLLIPNKASIEVKSISGNIRFQDIGGSAKAGVVSGDVEVEKARQGADCNSISGSLVLRDIDGDVYLKTVSGRIFINRIKGSIEGETVSGGIEMKEVSEARSVRAKALSGSILYQGKIHPEGRYNLRSHSGRIEMMLPSDSAFEFEADTFSGSIDTDFPMEVSGRISPREIRGIVGRGGASLKLSSFSGSIRLKKN